MIARLAPVEVLVFALHPDDEVIGTGGVVLQAIAGGKSVRIVFITNGDSYPRAASPALPGKRPWPLTLALSPETQMRGVQKKYWPPPREASFGSVLQIDLVGGDGQT